MFHVDDTLSRSPNHVGIRRREVQLRRLLTLSLAGGELSSLHSDRSNTKGCVFGSQRTGGATQPDRNLQPTECLLSLPRIYL